jgi:O-antigen/teichoic acid export membrane protein
MKQQKKVLHHLGTGNGITILSSWVARLTTVAVSLFTIPIMLKALTLDEFAIFAIVSGLNLWLVLSDLGIGKAVLNEVVVTMTKKKCVDDLLLSINVIILITIIAISLIIFSLSGNLAEILFRSSNISLEDKSEILLIAATLMAVSGSAGVVFKEWYAVSKGYIANIIVIFSQLITLTGCVIISTNDGINDKLFWFVFVSFFPIASISFIGLLVKTIIHFYLGGRFNLYCVKGILGHAKGFFIIGLMSAGVLGFDYIILSQYVNAEEIAVYNVVARFFSAIYVMFSVILLVLWPNLTRYAEAEDWRSFNKYTYSSILIGCAYIAIITILSMIFGNIVLQLIVDDKLEIPLLLFLCFGGYYLIRVWSDVHFTLLQSQSDLKILFWVTPVQAILSVSLQVILVYYWSYYGIILGVLLSYIGTVVWILPVSSRRYLKNFSEESAV